MVYIKATCSECRKDIELCNTAIHVTLFDHGRGHYYSFFCPVCFQRSKTFCDDFVVELLCGDGLVRSTLVHVPDEFLEVKGGPVISPDDVMDFVLGLEHWAGVL